MKAAAAANVKSEKGKEYIAIYHQVTHKKDAFYRNLIVLSLSLYLFFTAFFASLSFSVSLLLLLLHIFLDCA